MFFRLKQKSSQKFSEHDENFKSHETCRNILKKLLHNFRSDVNGILNYNNNLLTIKAKKVNRESM